MNKKIYLLIGLILLILAGILFSILYRQSQDTRTRAAGETTILQFDPTSGNFAPNAEIPVNITLNTFTNNVTGVDVRVLLSPELEFISFTPSNVFNAVLINNFDAASRTFRIASVNTSTSTITGVVSLGTLRVRSSALGNKTLSFTSAQITSSGQDTATPVDTSSTANIVITDGTTTITPSGTGVPPAGTTTPPTAQFSFTIFLHNIGKFGDTVNPTGFEFSNQNPLHPTKPVTVELISSNSEAIRGIGDITYNATNGNFTGTVAFNTQIPSKTYQIKIKSPQYLRKDLGLHAVGIGTTITFPTIDMVTGDINNDNKLDVLDYNIILTCYSSAQNPACTQADRVLTDINDDGKIDVTDYNLYIRESSVRNGE